MSTFRLSSRALADIDEITDYGVEKFGARATASYILGIQNLFAKLAAHPEIGRSAGALHPRTRRHPFRRHVVFYEREQAGIVVLRIYPMPRLLDTDDLP